jgi:mono/diheme cytochrome c family protein
LLLQWLSGKKKYSISPEVIKIILLCGLFSALISCITGYLLSLSGDYEEGLVNLHMWMGIAVAAASLLLVVKVIRQQLDLTHKIASFSLLILIVITGHLGGSLTHGSDYLTAAWNPSDDTADTTHKVIANVQEANAYADLVQPILQSKCYSCHGPNKQKGGLRLDDPKWLLKGGKDGAVLVSGKGAESELIKRLLLPREEEHHMPPKEKGQLTEKQIAVLHWWIDTGNDFTKKVKELPQSDKVKSSLLAMQSNGQSEHKTMDLLPTASVEAADPKAVQALVEKGVVVMPVAQNTHYLMANFVTAQGFSDQDMKLLMPLQQQLVWLKLGRTRITDSTLFILSGFSNLTQLDVSHTNVGDEGVSKLKTLDHLQLLNLVGTRVSAAGLLSLTGLKKLQSVYLYQSKIDRNGYVQLEKAFPKVQLDTGGYSIPFMESDTAVVRGRGSR